MKIIDKVKDYYDFLATINGIDENITFDRRGSHVFKDSKEDYCYLPDYIMDDVSKIPNWVIEKGKEKTTKDGQIFNFLLEIGFDKYLFKTIRKVVSPDEIIIEHALLKEFHSEKKLFNKGVIGMKGIESRYIYRNFYYTFDSVGRSFGEKDIIDNIQEIVERVSEKELNKVCKNENETLFINPILKNTFIPSFIPPEKIYQSVYDYLLKLKEPVIVDNSTDKEKIERQGMDVKTSFRPNMKD